MNFLYVFGGLACLAFGIWLIMHQVKTFLKKEQDELRFDIKGLGVGIVAIIIGIFIISKNI